MAVDTDAVSKVPPRRAASREGFNDFVVAGEEISYESALEKIETAAAPALRKITSDRSLAQFNQTDRIAVANFIASQSFRTEAFRVGLGSPPQDQFGVLFAELWRSFVVLSKNVLARHWAVLSIEHDGFFYLGDDPVVLQMTERPAKAGLLGLDIKGVELFMPLSPQCALYMPCASTSSEIISGYERGIQISLASWRTGYPLKALLPNDQLLISVARKTVASTGPIYRAFTEGNALQVEHENVENLNYLQCAWSHACLFSARPDFSFAQRVFRENPQYRMPLSVNIGFWQGSN